MSFSSLKSARAVKQAKSYVNAPETVDAHDPTSPSQDASVTAGQPPRAESEEIERDGLYSTLPAGVGIRNTAKSGRGIYAKESWSQGSIVCVVPPHVAVLSTPGLSAYCSSCFTRVHPDKPLQRCTQCRILHYCSQECQEADWALHKNECKALQRWAREAPKAEVAVPSDAIRCIARLLWRKQKRGPDHPWSREVDSMQSHRASLPLSAAESYSHMAHSLVRYLGLDSPSDLAPFGMNSPGDLVDLLSRFTTNTITLSDPTLTPIGLIVSPSVALFNHSCTPNAVVVFPNLGSSRDRKNTSAHVVALRDIHPGEEITTSYIDVTLPSTLRKTSLKETYYFTCTCDLCVPTTKSNAVDPREALVCPKSCGGSCPYPSEENPHSQCTKCGTTVPSPDSILDAIRLGQEGLEKATSLQFTDPIHSLRLTTNLTPLLTSAGLTPASHPLLALMRLHQSLLVHTLPSPPTTSDLDDAIRASAKVSAGLDGILCLGHPVRALALVELGKLLAVDEPAPSSSSGHEGETGITTTTAFPPTGPKRLAMAYQTLQRAHAELLVGFGRANEGGSVGREVHQLLVGLEKEIGVWKLGVKNVRESG